MSSAGSVRVRGAGAGVQARWAASGAAFALAVGEFQPTMSAARARQAAENADGAAYADAVSEYAALKRDELPAPTSGRD
ncbi:MULTISPECIES: hypothetical protein [unclassified Streptomyces]|uniref:hypothetical protein n=1 Tax=unclassified Streptomyces TaxID=2593676 RepID=UPI002E11E5E1|nr:hypothetical protein OG395_29710 [Streptomyces sp. NBC_01320]